MSFAGNLAQVYGSLKRADEEFSKRQAQADEMARKTALENLQLKLLPTQTIADLEAKRASTEAAREQIEESKFRRSEGERKEQIKMEDLERGLAEAKASAERTREEQGILSQRSALALEKAELKAARAEAEKAAITSKAEALLLNDANERKSKFLSDYRDRVNDAVKLLEKKSTKSKPSALGTGAMETYVDWDEFNKNLENMLKPLAEEHYKQSLDVVEKGKYIGDINTFYTLAGIIAKDSVSTPIPEPGVETAGKETTTTTTKTKDKGVGILDAFKNAFSGAGSTFSGAMNAQTGTQGVFDNTAKMEIPDDEDLKDLAEAGKAISDRLGRISGRIK